MGIIHKISGYLIERKGDDLSEYTLEDFKMDMQDSDIDTRHLHFESANVNEYFAENCDLAQLEKYFKGAQSSKKERNVKIGATYRHFKEKKLVKVIAVSQDTENVGSWSVVYECMDEDNTKKVWHRPLDMFLSEVDHEKYPNATQKWRFERVVK